MIVVFTTTCTVSAYREFISRSVEVYSTRHSVIFFFEMYKRDSIIVITFPIGHLDRHWEAMLVVG